MCEFPSLIEVFFNNLASIIIIPVDGLFGYLWHVFDIDRIKFTPDMIFLTRHTIEFSNDRLAMYDTFSFSLDNMYL